MPHYYEELSMKQRARILRLLLKFRSIYPIKVALTKMLELTNLTFEEEQFLAFLECGEYEKMIEERKAELESSEDTSSINSQT